MTDQLTVYVGYDSREQDAYDVCEYTLRKHASIPLKVYPISLHHPLFKRPWDMDGDTGQRRDRIDGRPFSTDFSFARFLVPVVQEYSGWALFCDCDFLWRADVADLYAQRDESKAVQLVMHDHVPLERRKMDGQEQAIYERKNWSSCVLWNCGHRAHSMVDDYRGIDTHKVNTYPGFFLHTFQWLTIKEIGALDESWNWLEGWSPEHIDPKAVHYTRGGPWFAEYSNTAYADEWRAALSEVRGAQQRKEAS